MSEEIAISIDKKIEDTESKIEELTQSIHLAKKEVQRVVELNAELSSNAQKARAETQAMGRGLGGLLLGSKFRGSRRREAASINADIAKQVAEQRDLIRERKQNAQNVVTRLQFQLKELKDEVKSLKLQRKQILEGEKKSVNKVKLATESMKALEKLHDLYQIGILTQEEYEAKRHAIMSKI